MGDKEITFENTEDQEAGVTSAPSAADTELFGVNILKAARYINLIIGTTLVVVGILSFLNVISAVIEIIVEPGIVILNFYLIVFGGIIMCSSFNMPCIEKNFFFLMTGLGKGSFNIFVGLILFLADEASYTNMIMGWLMIAAGAIFIFL